MSPDKPKKPKKSKGAKRREAAPASPAADPGPPYVVRWHPDAVAERDASWPPEEKAAIFNADEKLKAAGPRLGYPHSSDVRGEAGKGFRELRPRAGRSRWRPIYRRVNPSTFVIFAVGQEAGIDSASYDSAVDRAATRFADMTAE